MAAGAIYPEKIREDGTIVGRSYQDPEADREYMQTETHNRWDQ